MSNLPEEIRFDGEQEVDGFGSILHFTLVDNSPAHGASFALRRMGELAHEASRMEKTLADKIEELHRNFSLS